MYDAVETKSFIVIFLVKQTLFLVALIDIDKTMYSLIDLAGNGKRNKPNPTFIACFSPKIWLNV